MTVQIRNLSLLEQAIFMEWETDTETVVLEEMDTLLNNLKRTVCQKNPVTDYTCDVCDKTFDVTTDFKEHVKIHTEKVLHMCAKCEKTFEEDSQLKEHEKIHSRTDKNNCSVCDETENEQYVPESQGKNHSAFKQVKCNKCETSFDEGSELDEHMKKHAVKLTVCV